MGSAAFGSAGFGVGLAGAGFGAAGFAAGAAAAGSLAAGAVDGIVSPRSMASTIATSFCWVALVFSICARTAPVAPFASATSDIATAP